MNESFLWQCVLNEYPAGYAPRGVTAIDSNGGFSGARLWRIDTAAGPVCLRQWPREHPSRQQLQWIHAVLSQIAATGLGLIAAPIRTRSGATFVSEGGHYWQLEPWLPGRNDFRQRPSPERVAAALRALAQVHRAVWGTGGGGDAGGGGPELLACPAILERVEFCRELREGLANRLDTAIRGAASIPLGDRGERLLQHFRRRSTRLAELLGAAREVRVALQPCLRDVWHEHILFEGDQVRGIVDYGAMRVDCVAADISRLLGSMAGSDPHVWQIGLRAYEAVQQLPDEAAGLLPVLHESAVALSGMNWLRWLCLDRRRFPDGNRVLQRIDEILTDLEGLPDR